MSNYLIGTDVLCGESESVVSRSIRSVCGVVMGGPQPERGLAAGALELVAATFFPTPLRVVVGSIGALRVAYGLRRLAKGEP